MLIQKELNFGYRSTAKAGTRRNGEIIVDLFAGGGGASSGIEQALGRAVDVAINHDPAAVLMHEINHPATRHFTADVFEVDPVLATKGRSVGLLWASPDCKHFSRAKGAKPVEKRIRALAWVVVKWAAAVKPRVICLENVREFADWGPLTKYNRPCPLRKGLTFRRWVGRLKALGYEVETKVLNAADYGAPTNRKRLFLVARCDGKPIRWPEPTHGKGRLPHRPAAECIDWSIPCPSIFLGKEEAKKLGVRRPLAEKTLRRIAMGIKRYVLESPTPFLVHYHTEKTAFLSKYFGTAIGANLAEPMPTATGKHRFALVTVTIGGEQWVIVDIGMRMLTPGELAKAQGFPDDYVWIGSKAKRVSLIGNSVCPCMAKAIVAANYKRKRRVTASPLGSIPSTFD